MVNLQSGTCVIKNARIVLPESVISNGFLEIVKGRIVKVAEGNFTSGSMERIFDIQQATLTPGFIDLHVHGGNGGAFTSIDPAEHILPREFHLKNGTTSMLASTHTTEFASLLAILNSLSESSRSNKSGCKVLGIHTEGPFISEHKPGAHVVSQCFQRIVENPGRATVASQIHFCYNRNPKSAHYRAIPLSAV